MKVECGFGVDIIINEKERTVKVTNNSIENKIVVEGCLTKKIK